MVGLRVQGRWLFVLILFFTFGCSGSGRLALLTEYKDGLTINALQENWEAYVIYHSGSDPSDATVVIFDLIQDDKRIAVPESDWTKIQDEKTLSDVIKWVKDTKFFPRLYQIQGPDGSFYGYVYSAWESEDSVSFRATDDSTLKIRLREIPEFFFGGP